MATIYFSMATEEIENPTTWDITYNLTATEETMQLDRLLYDTAFASELKGKPYNDILTGIEEHILDYLELCDVSHPGIEMSIVGKINADESIEFIVPQVALAKPSLYVPKVELAPDLEQEYAPIEGEEDDDDDWCLDDEEDYDED